MPMPNLEGAVRYAYDRLNRELSPSLTYHSIGHTRDDVVVAARFIAEQLGLGEEDCLLIETAAAFHDLGFVIGREDHETHSITIMRAVLPQYGYDRLHIERVAGMIAATRIPQSPQNLSEQIIADADLDVLGRTDFLARNQLLRDETAAYGQLMGDEEWYRSQIGFMQAHTYWTPVARMHRNDGKQRNLEALRARIPDA